MTMRRRSEDGVTLVEVLVVLAIMGLLSGIAALAVGALDPGRRADGEAYRLADRLGLAADEALITARPQALVWDERGYRFLGWDPARGWSASAQRLLAERRALPGALRLESDGVPVPVVISPDMASGNVSLRVTGAATAWQVTFDGFTAEVSPVVP